MNINHTEVGGMLSQWEGWVLLCVFECERKKKKKKLQVSWIKLMSQIWLLTQYYLKAAFMLANFDHPWQELQQVNMLLIGYGCC